MGIVVLAAVLAYAHKTSMPAEQKISQVAVGSSTVSVEVADTEAKRELGLSYRDSLLPGNGMLFVFDLPDKYGFWMKDMSFSIDMIFIDQSGRVVTIAADAKPESYLQNPPEVFYPTAPIKYVLEVPAGFAQQYGIAVGSKVVLQ